MTKLLNHFSVYRFLSIFGSHKVLTFCCSSTWAVVLCQWRLVWQRDRYPSIAALTGYIVYHTRPHLLVHQVWKEAHVAFLSSPRHLKEGLNESIKINMERFKLWSNDRNMSTQHIATLLGATCCVRLATPMRRVATWWMLLAQVWRWSNWSHQFPTYRNTSRRSGQTRATCCAQQCCDMLRWHVAIVWPGL